MCGNHSDSGHSHSGHSHSRHSQSDHSHSGHSYRGDVSKLVAPAQTRTRRAFLGDVGKGSVAMALFTPAVLAACGADGAQTEARGQSADLSTPTSPTRQPESAPTSPPDLAAAADATAEQPASDGDTSLRWARADLGFVSAYVLARGNTAAIVDTGFPGSAEAIGQSLNSLGLNYSDVAHVILTHKHQDHVGAIDEVLALAINAEVYAGVADLDGISTSPITGVEGGEDVFGFEMLATPGHTAGHTAVIDHDAGLLVAGDAIFGEGSAVIEGPERFFADVSLSRQSITRLANFSYNTILFGHGEPIHDGGDAAVAALAASFS